MDFLYGHDSNLNFGDFEDPHPTDMLEPNNMFPTSSMEMGEDDSFLPSLTDDWFLNSIFGEGSELVYNDKNLGETASSSFSAASASATATATSSSASSPAQPPCIKSEHSYSSNNLSPASSPLGLASVKEEPDMGMFHNQTSSSTAMESSAPVNQLIHPAEPQTFIKCESPSPSSDPLLSAMISSEIGTSAFTSPTPTIILTTTTSSASSAVPGYGGQAVFPTTAATTTVHIKTDPVDAFDTLQEQTVNVDMVLPPTPPSSNGSDSDGSQSPQRSAPNSPQRQSPVRYYRCQPLLHPHHHHHHHQHHQHHYHHHHAASSSDDIDTCLAAVASPSHTQFSQPLFLSPMPQSGVLILTEEEKRTLISEGYPIPAKLPLTKQEEKNLKKVRRKIKNKISAQESRRKKKEYVEQLEKRVEAYNHENCDLKKKVESLQSDNRSLLGQLHKLQAMLAKGTKTAAASATQTGTVLMVLVLCFAVFLGGSGLGPSSLNVGYHRAADVSKPALVFSQQQPGPLKVQPNMGPGAPRAAPDTSDDYTTPNLKSRVLMAFSKEDPDDWCDEYRPLVPWDREESLCPTGSTPANDVPDGPTDPSVSDIMPVVSQTPVKGDGHQQSVAVVTIAMGSANGTAQEPRDDYQAMMHPDIAVAPTLGRGNFTADLETA